MEAVSGGASVVAFITIAVQSTKIIYNVLTGIEDGPQAVSLAASSVKGLQHALEQLAQRLIRNDQLPLVEFQNQIRNCSDDLREFASKLTKFEALETDSRARKLWKRLRTVLGEKDLERMMGAVATHSSTLNFWMNVLYGLDTQHWELLRAELTRADVQRQQQFSAISTSNESTRSNIDQKLQLLASNLDESRTQSEANQQDMNNKLSLVLDAVRSIVGSAGIKTTPKSPCFRPVDEEISESGHSSDAFTPTATSHGILPLKTEVPAILLRHEKILDCVNRLCGMVNLCEGTPDPETVDSVIEDLQTIIRAVKSQTKDSVSIRDLRRLSGLLDSAQTLSINDKAPRCPRPSQQGRPEQQLETYEVGNGTLEVRTKRRYLQQNPTTGETTPKRQRSGVEYIISKFKYLPHVRKGIMFSATIQQQTSHGGFFSPIPYFQANLIRPRDSLVFKLIREGRLSEFIGLLRDGEASLRDHDDLGRPLLWIAATNQQLRICQYLMEKHADPDLHGLEPGHTEEFPLIRACLISDEEEEEEIVRRANECRKILLEGGADPTIHSDYIGNAFSGIFETNIVDSMRTFLDFSVGFADIEWRNPAGETPLLAASSGSRSYSKESFEFLINRGANIHAVDNLGRGCLCWCLCGIDEARLPDIKRTADAIAYLIRNGADIYAKSNWGQSVSHFAYSTVKQRNSRRRDIWDFALAVCGHNVMEVRGNFMRVGRYSSHYTWSDFQLLWSGYEAWCPYPVDLVKAPPYQMVCSEEGDDDEHSHDSIDDEEESDDDIEMNDEGGGGEDNNSYDFIGGGNNPGIHNSKKFDINLEEDTEHNSGNEKSCNEIDIDDSLSEESGSDDFPGPMDWCCGRLHGNGTQCCKCGWSFRCRDPKCEDPSCSIRRSWNKQLNE